MPTVRTIYVLLHTKYTLNSSYKINYLQNQLQLAAMMPRKARLATITIRPVNVMENPAKVCASIRLLRTHTAY